GSQIVKLENLAAILQYIRQNTASWYEYVRSPTGRGHPLSNGALYLITGWEKTRVWGMASFRDLATHSYPFGALFEPDIDAIPGAEHCNYSWTASGSAETKSLEPINFSVGEYTPLNQTVFVQGFSIS
ncbi:hypothetical protein FB45DRAFT_729268, partial [Roridomyces roridus]